MLANIAGHHTFANQTAGDLEGILTDLVPGWNKEGVYNFQATASRDVTAEQLNLLKHDGSHPWIDKVVKQLVSDPYFGRLSDDAKTEHLCALINYLYEGTSAENVASGGANLARAGS